ncbi:FkbM family methyltransferase [Ideonella sp. BN130291]|uniref:FkbM family methyltransferase n=1 Tax=Ideonella sp. BN130291 TaxID=3112940 RepID=UPI002E264D3C|nr:FkbM family methyltransferase [Ideonella sp. BN130291]
METDQVTCALFRALLGRDAEPAAVANFRGMGIEAVARAIVESPEFRQRQGAATGERSPFWHYAARFDAPGLMWKYAVSGLQPRPGLIVNFLGVVIDPKFLPLILRGMAGEVQPVPMPSNWHADIAEWGAVLRAVDLAGDTFVVAELGCGWGCWLNNACVPAKRAGKQVFGIGVEGDPGHVEFAKEACALNGLLPSEIAVHHAIAGKDGWALFPRQEHAGHSWGLQAVFDATPEQRAEALRRKTHQELPMLSLATISGGKRLDLLHIDIQGAEVDVIRNSLDFLDSNVAYIMVGTHSKQIEGQLMDLLLPRGWVLEIERPAILSLAEETPLVTVDGVQGWRNRVLRPL